MIDFNNKGFFKLKQNDEYAERVSALLLDGEEVFDCSLINTEPRRKV
jgi:hypothetical protein